MGLDDIKNQVVSLHQAVMMLDLQYRLEAIDFLSDCCSDLRFKYLNEQDISGDQVLNLTTHKDSNSFDHQFNIRESSFYDSQLFKNDDKSYDFNDALEASDDIEFFKDDMYSSSDNETKYGKSDTGSDPGHPVNLVMPAKLEPSSRGSRRKQMFTRKSLRQDRIDHRISSCDDGTKNNIVKHISDINETASALQNGAVSCRSCHSEFSGIAEHRLHLEQLNCRSKYGFQCVKCGDKFKYETHYIRHLAGHKDNDCKYCKKKLSSGTLLRKHLKEAHPDIKVDYNMIPCKFCPKSFSRLFRLYYHYQLQHSKGRFVCTSCGLFLSTKEKHREHMADHEMEKEWACQLCDKKFIFKNNLTKHIKAHESCLYKCVTCNISVISKLELLSHKRKNHQVEGLKDFQCDLCQKQFLKKSVLVRHMASHNTSKEYSCKICVRLFGSSHALNKHLKTKTHYYKANVKVPESKYEKVYEDMYVCENCGKQYITYAKLKAHTRIHQTTYYCDLCNATFTIKENLARHIKKHTESKLATCELCGDSFSRTDGLRVHRMTKHADNRDFPCTSCPKAFKRKSDLNRHMHIHTLVRPYVCYCGRSYKQSAHLRSHQMSVHSKAPVMEPKVSESERYCKNYLSSDLALENFAGQDYQLPESFKQNDNYSDGMEYCELPFESQPSVSPAVDLSMVSISWGLF